MRSHLIPLATLLAVSGCASGFHSSAPPAQVYVLRITGSGENTVAASPVDISIRVGRPLAGPGLDSDHIVLVQPNHRMSHYAASRWPADLPEVVEALVVEKLRATGVWTSVQDSLSPFPADYMLRIAIRRFEADYTQGGGAPQVHVVLDCVLGRRSGREVVASFVAEGSSAATDNRLSAVVSAFEHAVNEALAIVSERTYEAASADRARMSRAPSPP